MKKMFETVTAGDGREAGIGTAVTVGGSRGSVEELRWTAGGEYALVRLDDGTVTGWQDAQSLEVCDGQP